MNVVHHVVSSYEMAQKSPDPSTQNGAILLGEDLEVIGAGWNDFPSGVNPDHWHGPKDGKYARVVHAEVSAILDAARKGISTQSSTLVCPWAACSNCAKHIAAAGVARLVRHPLEGDASLPHWHDDCMIGDEIMNEAGIEIIEIPVVSCGISLRRNGKIWNP